MHNYRSLRILDRFQGLFQAFQVDYPIMRKILQLKLTMDERRVPTIFSQTKKKDGNQFLKSLGLYALYGLLIIPFLFFGDSYMLQMSIIFGITLFILMTSLISDFSTVLLDVRDKMILNTKPISDRTINTAKIVHIGIYLTLLTGAFLGIPAIVILVKKGVLFFLIFLVTLVFQLLLIIALTALVYMLILRFFDGERLKDIINYVQILLSVSIFIGYQILVRSFEFVDLTMTYQFQWWHVFIPPLWFGAPFELLLKGQYQWPLILLAVLAILLPILSIAIYVRLMPAFEKNLQKLLGEEKGVKAKRGHWQRMWARILCTNKEERTFFRFAWQMMGQERAFKLKVYPSLGIGFIAPFIFTFNTLLDKNVQALKQSNDFFAIYFSLLIIGSIVMILPYSSKFKGAWVYHVTPVQNQLNLDRAAIKAGIAKLFLPIYFVQSAIFIFLYGWRIVPDLGIVLVTGLIYGSISYRFGNGGQAPFSSSIDHAFESGTGKQIAYMLMTVGFLVVHVFMRKMTFGLPIYLFVLLTSLFIMWKVIFREKVVIE